MKKCYGYKNNHQLKKRYKSVTAFSLSNADFLTLISLSSCNLYSDCICVPFYKSIHNYFIKPTLKPFQVSSIKPVPVALHKCSVYRQTPSASNRCVQVSVNKTICKTSTNFNSKCMVNICHKMFKMSYQVFLSIKFQFHRLSVGAVSFSFVDVTTTPIYKYTTLATKHATVRKFVLSSRINISSAPVVVIFSSYLTSL